MHRQRPCAGAAVGRRFRQLGRAGRGLTFDDKQAVTRALLRSGPTSATSTPCESICRASKVGGSPCGPPGAGGYARHLRRTGRRSGGDRLGAHGPRSHDARRRPRHRRRFASTLPPVAGRALADPANETQNPDDPAFATDRIQADRTARRCFPIRGARQCARQLRAGAARRSRRGRGARGRRRACRARARLATEGRRAVILSGGELTVTISGGRGGPNQEYALALAYCASRHAGIAALAGRYRRHRRRRGSPSRSGRRRHRLVDAQARAALGLDPAAFLADNDFTGFFSQLGDLVLTGPTYTNVNDFRAILVDSP